MAENKPQTALKGAPTETRGNTTIGAATTQPQPTFSVGPIKNTSKAKPTIAPAPPTIAPKSAVPTVVPVKPATPTVPVAGPVPQNPPKTVAAPKPAVPEGQKTVIPQKPSSNHTARGADPLQAVKNETVRPVGVAPPTIRPAGPAVPTIRPVGPAVPTLRPAAQATLSVSAAVSADPGRTTMASEATVTTNRPETTIRTATGAKVPARSFEETKTMGRFEYSISIKPEKPVFYKGQTWLTLFIFNTSKFRLCFRIVPPDPHYFTVYPLSGFIDVGKSTYVAIQRLQPTIECLDCLDIEFGPDTGVQQASILFEDAYCDYDRIQVPIRCTGEVEPKKTKA
ncbi:unnamed protein product [Bursaphelenchus xylophilus]|uniref:(pine wood nematode) hypothetical protein n=1 Tax=Bursaphelenchus xylophilus TaxID=6326 RepID=A0A7I8X3T2_BURXY|nr:unnamed protein product [Bursaphelenchus xylophilus]CAG9128643.1 unnamed protein product [Bursaphelenchus xylophilus]